MKKLNLIIGCIAFIFLSGCDSEDGFSDPSPDDPVRDGTTASAGNSGNGGGNSGIITAGEWNDLYNWEFWNDLLTDEKYSDKPGYWGFYTNNRLAVLAQNGSTPIVNAKVELKRNEVSIWQSKTDNFGKAELWIDLFQKNNSVTISDFSLFVNDEKIETDLKLIGQGVNEVQINSNQEVVTDIDLAFIVDATGSMSDELRFLKNELRDVIQRAKGGNPSATIKTSAVFYRDKGEEYLVRKSDFTSEIETTLSFIENQRASGGGDFPEAVDAALKTAIYDLQWNQNARTRIAFLLLDAPAHHELQVLESLQQSIKEAAKKGIKLIPITASGIDKETEFLMRFFSISTNGTYVFITNDSGVGNDHIEASVGSYQIEYLNNLLIRLIDKYSK